MAGPGFCRAALLFLLLLAVAACGFRPLYQKGPEGEAVTEDMARTRVLVVGTAEPRDARLGQQLQNMLLDRMNPAGRSAEPLYSLSSRLSLRSDRLGLLITEEATRTRLTATVDFQLRDVKTGQVVFRGTEQSISTYNIGASEFATVTAERDAAERLVRDIGDMITLRVGMYFDGQRTARAAP